MKIEDCLLEKLIWSYDNLPCSIIKERARNYFSYVVGLSIIISPYYINFILILNSKLIMKKI